MARDPRGMVRSRDKLGPGDVLHTKHETRSIESTCRRAAGGVKYVLSATGAQEFYNEYKVVRYVMLTGVSRILQRETGEVSTIIEVKTKIRSSL